MTALLQHLEGEDIDEIIRIWSIAGLPIDRAMPVLYADLKDELKRENVAYIGLLYDDQLVAVGVARYDGQIGWISDVAVDPDYRNHSYAGQIISELEGFLKSCGATKCHALIDDINYPAISSACKSGFKCEADVRLFSKDL